MGRIAAKKEALALLASDLEGAMAFLLDMEPGLAVHILFSGIVRSERPLRWHAVTAMGSVVATLADRDIEAARVVMRRLIWSLNDESGGIGWGSPEAMAEIMTMHDVVAAEYLSIFVSYMSDHAGAFWRQGNSYVENKGLQKGLLWGVGRLTENRKKELAATPVHLLLPPYLDEEDPEIQGMAVRALGLLRVHGAKKAISALVDDMRPVELYENNTLFNTSVGRLAEDALTLLGQ